MTKVQGPAIGNALRSALDLDAAGGLPMDADTTIVPVAVVADVRELLTTKYIPVFQAATQSAVAAEHPYCGVSWNSGTLPTAKRILVDAMIVSAEVVTSCYFGYKSGGLAGTFAGLPRRKVASLSASNVTGVAASTTSVSFPTTFIDRFAGVFLTPANTPIRIVFAEPIILDAENQAFVVGLATLNTSLRCSFEWREERA